MHTRLEEKAWGSVRHLFDTPQCAVSVLNVEAGGYSSKHFHEWRVNRFVVISGEIEVVHYVPQIFVPWHFTTPAITQHIEKRFNLKAGDVHDVPAKVIHRFEVLESGIVIEVYWPSEGVSISDIQRLDIGGNKNKDKRFTTTSNSSSATIQEKR